MKTRSEELRILVAAHLGIPPDSLDMNRPLSEYGADSLDLVELLFKIETQFGIRFPTLPPRMLNTLGDIDTMVDYAENSGTRTRSRPSLPKADTALLRKNLQEHLGHWPYFN